MRKTTAARTDVPESRVRRKPSSLAKRRLRLRLQVCLWCVLLPPLGLVYLSHQMHWLHRRILRSFTRARYGRIAVVDIGFDKKDDTAFATATVEALRLIETTVDYKMLFAVRFAV